MIGMYAFMLSSLLISRKAVEISHTHVENCMHARAGLDFVSCHEPTKRSQSGDWQPPQPPQKVATSIYVLSSNHPLLTFPRAYKAKLTSSPDDTNDAI